MQDAPGAWRTLKYLAASLALAVLLLSVGAAAFVWSIHRDFDRWSDDLIDRTLALRELKLDRPSHAKDPIDGSFWELAAPHLAGVGAHYEKMKEGPDQGFELAREVIDGKRRSEDLPEAVRLALEASSAAAAEGLHASRARSAAPDHPPWPFQSFDAALDDSAAHQHRVRLAAFEIRRLVESGDAARAWTTCLDGFGYSRDLAYRVGLIQRMISNATAGLLFEPCAAAIADAPVDFLAGTRSALELILNGLVPFSEVMTVEAVQGPLMTCGAFISEHRLARLGDGPASQAVKEFGTPGYDDSDFPSFLLKESCVRNGELVLQVAEVVRTQGAERAEKLARLAETSPSPILSLFQGDLGAATDWEDFAQRVELQQAQLELLLTALDARVERARSGAWPVAPERPLLTVEVQPDGALRLSTPAHYAQSSSLVLAPR